MGAWVLIWLESFRSPLFSWHCIWFSICLNKSLPGWIINYMSPLNIWNKISDLTPKHILELFGIN